MAENKTIQSILGNTALDIGTYAVNQANKFAESDLGQALFYLPSIIMGARVGNQVEESLPAMKEGVKNLFNFFKGSVADRKTAKQAWNNLGAEGQKDYLNFRDFYKQTVQRNVKLEMQQMAGDKMVVNQDFSDKFDVDPSTVIGDRTLKNMVDRTKIRAFYANSLNDYKYNPNTGQTEQTTPISNVNPISPDSTSGDPVVAGAASFYGSGNVRYENDNFAAIDSLTDYGITVANNGMYSNLVEQNPQKNNNQSGTNSIFTNQQNQYLNNLSARFGGNDLLSALNYFQNQFQSARSGNFLKPGTPQNQMFQNSAFGKSFNPNTGKYE